MKWIVLLSMAIVPALAQMKMYGNCGEAQQKLCKDYLATCGGVTCGCADYRGIPYSDGRISCSLNNRDCDDTRIEACVKVLKDTNKFQSCSHHPEYGEFCNIKNLN